MRINLNVPYVEKDSAKALGARWDASNKIWYLEDVEDLTPFMKWIPKMGYEVKLPMRKAKNPGRRERAKVKNAKAFGQTVSVAIDCGCDHVLPWEHCEHTATVLEVA